MLICLSLSNVPFVAVGTVFLKYPFFFTNGIFITLVFCLLNPILSQCYLLRHCCDQYSQPFNLQTHFQSVREACLCLKASHWRYKYFLFPKFDLVTSVLLTSEDNCIVVNWFKRTFPMKVVLPRTLMSK